jgi:hypothetical protein
MREMSFLPLTTLLLASQFVAAAPRATRCSLSCPAANSTTFPASNGEVYQVECGIDHWGGDMSAPNGQTAATLDACIGQCAARPGCVSAQWLNKSACYLKSTINPASVKSTVWGAVLITNSAATTKSTPTVTATTTKTVTASSSLDAKAVTASSSPTPTGSTSGSCAKAKALSSKRGLAFNDPKLTTLFGSKVTWAYNWGQTAGNGFNSKLEYSPMLWGTSGTSIWNSNAKAAIAAGSDTLLSFNEPDLSSQSNLDPTTAANLFKQYMQPFACQARLSSPAVTNGGAPMGLSWLQSFLSQCTGCTIDVVPIHWYAPATAIDDFKSHVQQAYAAGGNRPLWITEFGLTDGTDDQKATFFQTILPWLDSQLYVERYAYFMDAPNYLLNSASTGLSAIGQLYNTI